MTKTIDTKPLGQELEQRAASPNALAVFDLLARSKPEIAKLLPPGVGVDRFERILRTEGRRTPKLLDANPYAFMGAVMHCAQLGLEPGPLQLVHLIPFGGEVQVIVGWRGLVELTYRSGYVKALIAELVYEGDHFRPRKGSKRILEHDPLGARGEREVVAAYGVADMKTGGTVWRDIYEEDWERARKASALGSKGKGLWADQPEVMILKTAYRRLADVLPKSPAYMYAAAIDDRPALHFDEMTHNASTPDELTEAVTVDALTDEPGDVPVDEDGGS